MPRVRSRWARLALAVVVLLLLGGAAYKIGVTVWTSGHYRAALRALERYDFDEAREHLEQYLSVYPDDGEVRLLAAQTARRQGDFNEAESQLRRARQLGMAADAIATERQLLAVHMGDLTDAPQLAGYCKEHPSEPGTVVAFEALIEGSLKAVNPSLAKWAVDLWLRHRTGNADQVQGLVLRGRVYEFLQDHVQARADYEKALASSPDHLQARLRLAELLTREAPGEAAPQLDWLQRHKPQHPEVRLLSARLYRNLGQPEKAAPLLDELLAATPDRVPVLVERGRVALELHQPRDAERWLLRALALAPAQRDVNLALADCLRQAGRLDEAKRYQDRAGEIDARLNKVLEELQRKAKGSDAGN